MSISAQEIADVLIDGRAATRKGIAQFSDNHPDIPVDTAYAAQKAFIQSKLDAGETFVGWKLGLTSRNKQRAMGLDAPLYGRVTSGMLSTYGDPVRLDRFIHPRVESEIAFLLARDVAAPATITSVLAATDVVFGAVDVLDSRYESFQFTLSDVVADNASAGAFYLGPVARRPDELVDLRLLGCVVRVDGEVAMTAAGAAVMGHPAASVAWLANQLAAAERGGAASRPARLLRRGHRPGPGGGRGQRHLRVRRARRHRGVRRLSRSVAEHGSALTMQALLTSSAVVVTDAPARYAKQLLAHLGRKNTVEPSRRRPGRRPAGVRVRQRHALRPGDGQLVLTPPRPTPRAWRTSRTCCSGTWSGSAPATSSSSPGSLRQADPATGGPVAGHPHRARPVAHRPRAAGGRGRRLDPRVRAVRRRPSVTRSRRTPRAEAEQVFTNLAAILAAAGAGADRRGAGRHRHARPAAGPPGVQRGLGRAVRRPPAGPLGDPGRRISVGWARTPGS